MCLMQWTAGGRSGPTGQPAASHVVTPASKRGHVTALSLLPSTEDRRVRAMRWTQSAAPIDRAQVFMISSA